MKNKYYTSRDPIKNYFPLPNEVFVLGLSPDALAVYSYLMYIEDRTTYQCHASYKTIGNAVNMSPNTVRKYVAELVERGLIQTERTTIITQDGRKQNGSLLYTLLPIQFSIQQFYEQKLAKLDAECEQERIRKRLEAFQQAQQENARPPAGAACRGCVRFSGYSRARAHRKPKNRTLRRRAGEQKIRPKPSAAGSVERGNAANVEHAKMGRIWRFWTPRRESSEKAARKQDKTTGSCAPRGGHICPRCGQFRGFVRTFQKQRKSAPRRCSTKKARRFKENGGVPTKNTG